MSSLFDMIFGDNDDADNNDNNSTQSVLPKSNNEKVGKRDKKKVKKENVIKKKKKKVHMDDNESITSENVNKKKKKQKKVRTDDDESFVSEDDNKAKKENNIKKKKKKKKKVRTDDDDEYMTSDEDNDGSSEEEVDNNNSDDEIDYKLRIAQSRLQYMYNGDDVKVVKSGEHQNEDEMDIVDGTHWISKSQQTRKRKRQHKSSTADDSSSTFSRSMNIRNQQQQQKDEQQDDDDIFLQSSWLHYTSLRNRKNNEKDIGCYHFLLQRKKETDHHHKLRILKWIQSNEYNTIRSNWKKRKVKFSNKNDIDVGNALSHHLNIVNQFSSTIIPKTTTDDLIPNLTSTTPDDNIDPNHNDDTDVEEDTSDTESEKENNNNHRGIIKGEDNINIKHEMVALMMDGQNEQDNIFTDMNYATQLREDEDEKYILDEKQKEEDDVDWNILLNLDYLSRGLSYPPTRKRTNVIYNNNSNHETMNDHHRFLSNHTLDRYKRLVLLHNHDHDPKNLRITQPEVDDNNDESNNIQVEVKNEFNHSELHHDDAFKNEDEHERQSITYNNSQVLRRTLIQRHSTRYPFRNSIFPMSPFSTIKNDEHSSRILYLAARQIYSMGGSGNDSEKSSSSLASRRLIHLLWTQSVAGDNDVKRTIRYGVGHYDRNHLLQHHVRQLGKNLQCFYHYKWGNNRNDAALALGVAFNTSSKQHGIIRNGLTQLLGSNVFVGSKSYSSRFDSFREKNVRDMSKKDNKRKPIHAEWVRQHQNQKNGKNVADDPLSDVVIPLREVYEYNNRRGCLRTKNYFYELVPTYHNYYSYSSGCIPPIPTFPLDEVGIILGPKHPFHSVHVIGKIPCITIKITISSFISRLLVADEVKRNQKDHQIRKQLHIVIDTAVEQNQSKLFRRLAHTEKHMLELPLFFYFETLMTYCSVVCHGYVAATDIHMSTEYNDDNDHTDFRIKRDPDDSSDFEEDNKIGSTSAPQVNDDVVKHLYRYLESRVSHNGLGMFSRIHVLFGVLKIASSLPSSSIAIRMLLHTEEESTNVNIFIRLRNMLLSLEQEGYIVENMEQQDHQGNEVIIPIRFEFNLHEAVRIFSNCIERNPNDVNCVCWYLGTLATSLLIASGNRIGSGAHCYPSTYKQNSEDTFLSTKSKKKKNLVEHEIRSCLPNFQEIRMYTLYAFKFLLNVGAQTNDIRAYMAITSFLEWSEVQALLIGRHDILENETSAHNSICDLHKHLKTSYSLLCPSESNLKSLISETENYDNTIRLNALASLLESNPSIKDHWVGLVAALGPICDESNPTSCIGLNQSETQNHAIQDVVLPDAVKSTMVPDEFQPVTLDEEQSYSTTSNQNELFKQQWYKDWWGSGRSCWWNDTLLRVSQSETPLPRKLKFSFQSLKTALKNGVVVKRQLSDTKKTEYSDISMKWIDDAIESTLTDPVDSPVSLEERNFKMDDFLPQKRSLSSSAETASSPIVSPFDFIGVDSEVYEMIAYKILIICHLNSIYHTTVEKTFIMLLVRSWNKNAFMVDTNAFRCLIWLHRMGVNVVNIIESSKILKDCNIC